jgi:uncharacterized protein (TIGR00251 family)
MPAAWFRWEGQALILSLRIQPGAKQSRLDGQYGDRLKIRIVAPPVDGKANQQLVNFFAQLCGIGKSQISLLSGPNSRNKLIRIDCPKILPDGVSPPND